MTVKDRCSCVLGFLMGDLRASWEWKRVAALPRAPPGGQAWEVPRFPFQEAL